MHMRIYGGGPFIVDVHTLGQKSRCLGQGNGRRQTNAILQIWETQPGETVMAAATDSTQTAQTSIKSLGGSLCISRRRQANAIHQTWETQPGKTVMAATTFGIRYFCRNPMPCSAC